MRTPELVGTDETRGVSACGPDWFALRVAPHHERRAGAALERQGVESYVPLYTERRRWSDRYKQVELPLFPGYLFSRLPAPSLDAVLALPGILHVLPSNLDPLPVDAAEVDLVRRLCAAGRSISPSEWRPGDRVTVRTGPLAGASGTVAREKDQTHLIVSFPLFGRTVAVEVDAATLAAARESCVWP